MDVSENSGTPKSSILIGFSIKPSIWGYHYFWVHPYETGTLNSVNAIEHSRGMHVGKWTDQSHGDAMNIFVDGYQTPVTVLDRTFACKYLISGRNEKHEPQSQTKTGSFTWDSQKLNHECNFSSSGQIIKFHQPGFTSNKGLSLP